MLNSKIKSKVRDYIFQNIFKEASKPPPQPYLRALSKGISNINLDIGPSSRNIIYLNSYSIGSLYWMFTSYVILIFYFWIDPRLKLCFHWFTFFPPSHLNGQLWMCNHIYLHPTGKHNMHIFKLLKYILLSQLKHINIPSYIKNVMVLKYRRFLVWSLIFRDFQILD